MRFADLDKRHICLQIVPFNRRFLSTISKARFANFMPTITYSLKFRFCGFQVGFPLSISIVEFSTFDGDMESGVL